MATIGDNGELFNALGWFLRDFQGAANLADLMEPPLLTLEVQSWSVMAQAVIRKPDVVATARAVRDLQRSLSELLSYTVIAHIFAYFGELLET